MQMHGEPVHGERIVDGDSSALTVLALYKDGTTTVRTLAADEHLYITDVIISLETAADFSLVADSGAGGRYIVWGTSSVHYRTIVIQFRTPYCCPKGVVPKFSGAGTNRSACLIQGFITKA